MPSYAKIILLLFSLLQGAFAQAPASIEVILSSRMLVVGEQTRLTVIIRNARIIDWPDSPIAAPLALTRLDKNHFSGRKLHDPSLQTENEARHHTITKPSSQSLPDLLSCHKRNFDQARHRSVSFWHFSRKELRLCWRNTDG